MKAFTIICGADDFLVVRRGAELWAQLSASVTDDFAKEVIDGNVNTVDEVGIAVGRFISAVQTLPMFGDKKVVWFRGLSFLGDTRPGGTEGAKEQIARLQEILAGLDGDAVSVVITASPFSRRSKKQVEWWKKEGDYQFVEADKDGGGLLVEMEHEAKKLGVRLDKGAARLLVEKINGNTRLALEEVRKLSLYVEGNGGVINEAAVSDMVPNFGEGDFFETAEAFYALDLGWTLEAIRRHFFAGYDARPMITSLQNRNRLLIQLKVLQDARVIGQRISKGDLDRAAGRYVEHFGDAMEKTGFNVFTQNPWYLGRLATPLNRLSLKQLIGFQASFLEAFTGILERPNEQESVMRDVVIQCLGT